MALFVLFHEFDDRETSFNNINFATVLLHIIVNIKQTSDQNKGKYKLGDY